MWPFGDAPVYLLGWHWEFQLVFFAKTRARSRLGFASSDARGCQGLPQAEAGHGRSRSRVPGSFMGCDHFAAAATLHANRHVCSPTPTSAVLGRDPSSCWCSYQCSTGLVRNPKRDACCRETRIWRCSTLVPPHISVAQYGGLFLLRRTTDRHRLSHASILSTSMKTSSMYLLPQISKSVGPVSGASSTGDLFTRGSVA